MNGVIVSLARMLLFRGGPQNLPASWSLTFLMVAAYLAQNLITGQQLVVDGGQIVPESLEALRSA